MKILDRTELWAQFLGFLMIPVIQKGKCSLFYFSNVMKWALNLSTICLHVLLFHWKLHGLEVLQHISSSTVVLLHTCWIRKEKENRKIETGEETLRNIIRGEGNHFEGGWNRHWRENLLDKYSTLLFHWTGDIYIFEEAKNNYTAYFIIPNPLQPLLL